MGLTKAWESKITQQNTGKEFFQCPGVKSFKREEEP
jgi:hypothetical protein